ncbi:hypothetical protein GCM10011319_28440 [Mameliella alba]|nr:hypothetical protein GCM10011319_28440 [Mameliella alba]
MTDRVDHEALVEDRVFQPEDDIVEALVGVVADDALGHCPACHERKRGGADEVSHALSLSRIAQTGCHSSVMVAEYRFNNSMTLRQINTFGG